MFIRDLSFLATSALLPVFLIVVSGCDDFDSENANDRSTTTDPAPIIAVEVAPDGQLVACCHRGKVVTLRDRRTLKVVRTLISDERLPMVARFHPQGGSLLVGYYDGSVGIWNLKSEATEPNILGFHSFDIRCAAFSADGNTAATGDGRGAVHLWENMQERVNYRVIQHACAVWSVVFSPDGREVVTAGSDGKIRIWDVATLRELRVLSGHRNVVRGVRYLSNPGQLASSGLDGTIRIWDVNSGRELLKWNGHRSGLRTIACSLKGGFLAAAPVHPGDIYIWDTRSLNLVSRIPAHHIVTDIAFAPDGTLFSCGADGNLLDWKLTPKNLTARADNRSTVTALGAETRPVGNRSGNGLQRPVSN